MKPRRLTVIRPFGPPHQVEQYDLTEMVKRELARQEKRQKRQRKPQDPQSEDALLQKE